MLADPGEVVDVARKRSSRERGPRPEVRALPDPRSVFRPRSTSAASAPTRSAMVASSFANATDAARKAFRPCFTSPPTRLPSTRSGGEGAEQLLERRGRRRVGSRRRSGRVARTPRSRRRAVGSRASTRTCAPVGSTARAAASSRREAATRRGSRRSGRQRRRALGPFHNEVDVGAIVRVDRGVVGDPHELRASRASSRSVVKRSEPAASSRRTRSASPGSSTGARPPPDPRLRPRPRRTRRRDDRQPRHRPP